MQNTKPYDRISEILCDEIEQVDKLIQARMISENAPRIPQITAHIINAGGKRLRPLLTLATAKLCGNKTPYHIHLAATVEFIHTATLLHDDVIDESEHRRGRPTANLLWDNPSSILVGDYLFSRSFQLMVETNNLQVLTTLANASATISEGEVLQLSVTHDIKTTEDIYLKIAKGKTAALFEAACKVGGIISNAPDSQLRALATYGNAIGISFQIVDDLLDYTGSKQNLGKNTGDDFRERKLSLPLIKAIASSNAQELEFWKRTINKGEQKENDFSHALEIMEKYGAITQTRQDALAWALKAKDSLSVFPKSELRDLLISLPNYIVERIS